MSFYEPYFSKTILLCCTFRISMMLCGLCFKRSNVNMVFFFLEQFEGLSHSSGNPDDFKKGTFFKKSFYHPFVVKNPDQLHALNS